ncbi:SufD family Fe-S cluster assembly protein [Spiroplasma endosymbiont of Panorpa germanica]|uniref:SufB/SufD family protein n=1 Tax=Spiroplasma endosymbiont of Panorpa germanica TaxID=3066314 RepID=UPI0030CBFAFF
MSEIRQEKLKLFQLDNQFDLLKKASQVIEYKKSQTSFIIIEKETNKIEIKIAKNVELELIILNLNQNKISTAKKLEIVFNLAENSKLVLRYANLSNENIDENILINLNGPNSSVDYYSATIAFDNLEKHSFINPIHLARNTTSDISSYTIIKDKALGFVKCASDIRNGSTNSEAHQELRLLILDKTARAHSDPILLIDENDIVASHANAIGMLDQEQIFYLNSRGLNDLQAKELLIMGFFKPILELISLRNQDFADYLTVLLKEKIK